MFLTSSILLSIMPKSGENAYVYLEPLQRAMARYKVDNKLEVAAFLATIAEESGELRYVKEIWGPTEAQKRYEFSKTLGNIQEGDGKKYCGRGLIEVTGRNNYLRYGALMGLDLLNRPELLEQPVYAADSAALFWWDHNIDAFADRGDFRRVTRIVNGGLTNWEKREEYYKIAKSVLRV